jgi:DnaJ-class molecular chaperone
MSSNYLIKKTEICRRCLGEGVLFDLEMKATPCTLCKGTGMVIIEKKIEVTITPKYPMPYA